MASSSLLREQVEAEKRVRGIRSGLRVIYSRFQPQIWVAPFSLHIFFILAINDLLIKRKFLLFFYFYGHEFVGAGVLHLRALLWPLMAASRCKFNHTSDFYTPNSHSYLYFIISFLLNHTTYYIYTFYSSHSNIKYHINNVYTSSFIWEMRSTIIWTCLL